MAATTARLPVACVFLFCVACNRMPKPEKHETALTDQMQRALDSVVPGFVTLTARDYSPGADTSYYARGDFNGDGSIDVALLGRDSAQRRLLVVMSDSVSRYRIIMIQQFPLREPSQPELMVLKTHPPGVVEIPEGLREVQDSAVPKRLVHDSFDVIYGEAASEQYYWNGKSFSKIVTGD